MSLLLVQPADAHDFWIEPHKFVTEPGGGIDVRLRQGVGFKGDTLPYVYDWFQDFSTVDISGREPVFSLQGDDPAARLAMPNGQLLIGYQSNRALAELDAEKFESYIEEEGLEFIRAEREAAGQTGAVANEYFVRCAKALLQADAGEAKFYATELGYRLELIPTTDPYSLQAGDSLTFRLLWRGKPAPGLLVQAFTRDAPERIQKVRVAEDGTATIELHSAGVWMVKAVSIQRIIGSPSADWLSHWASFLFELP